MRLGQLSRKLDIPIPEIVSIVANEFDVTIGDHPNIKMDDSHVFFIEEVFKKEEVEILVESDDKKELKSENKELSEPKEEITEDAVSDKKEEEAENITESSEIETIRAKAAKLEGLTVVDKIDLPEPPPPEMVEIDGVMYDKAELKKQRIAERKERDANRKKEAAKRAAEGKVRVKKKPVKKEVSFAEKRRIEEKKETTQKKTEDKFKRKRQRKHYESKHKIAPPVNNKKKKPIIIEVEEPTVNSQPEPETLLGKFWRWLNTY